MRIPAGRTVFDTISRSTNVSSRKSPVTPKLSILGYMLLHKSYINMAIPDRLVGFSTIKRTRKSLKRGVSNTLSTDSPLSRFSQPYEFEQRLAAKLTLESMKGAGLPDCESLVRGSRDATLNGSDGFISIHQTFIANSGRESVCVCVCLAPPNIPSHLAAL
eukprot:sb/3472795/